MIIIYTWFSQMLREEYEKVSLLKETPRSSIMSVRHKATGRQFILRRFIGNPEVYQKLLEISCPNLPTVYEVAVGEKDNLVLEEYVWGDTLDFLLREALFTQSETRRIVRQICQGLWVLHSLGVVHRDLKPENVILRGSDAVLIDFDAARLHKVESSTDTQILGTTGFAAPEQYGLGQSDPRTDVYSLGIFINVMLTGEHPSKKQAGGRLGRVVERCTHVNPDKRYQSVLRLMEEL